MKDFMAAVLGNPNPGKLTFINKIAGAKLSIGNRHGVTMEENSMMPLTLAAVGEEIIIKKVGGKAGIKKRLEDLGFIVGGNVTVIAIIGGNVIVNIKESRIAISKEMAGTIMI